MARDLPNILLIQADQLKPRVLPGYGGPAAVLGAEVRAGQRERRFVQSAHGNGPAPLWDAFGSDPVRASCLRAPDDYNDWAWRGIEPSAP